MRGEPQCVPPHSHVELAKLDFPWMPVPRHLGAPSLIPSCLSLPCLANTLPHPDLWKTVGTKRTHFSFHYLCAYVEALGRQTYTKILTQQRRGARCVGEERASAP